MIVTAKVFIISLWKLLKPGVYVSFPSLCADVSTLIDLRRHLRKGFEAWQKPVGEQLPEHASPGWVLAQQPH